MNRKVRKRIFEHMYPAKIQIGLRIRAVFTGRSLESKGYKISSCGPWMLWSDCADAQADVSLR